MEALDREALSIAEISNKLKIPKHTLRFWEKEFHGMIVPLRTQGGQRRYGREHIAVIETIRKLRERGLSLSQIKCELGPGARGPGAREGQGRSTKIDQLATRVAEAVKTEVYNFLMVEEGRK